MACNSRKNFCKRYKVLTFTLSSHCTAKIFFFIKNKRAYFYEVKFGGFHDFPTKLTEVFKRE